jgi:hypothetical protein
MQAAKLNYIAYGQLRKEKTKKKKKKHSQVYEEYNRDMQMPLLGHILDIVQLSTVKKKVQLWVIK